MIVNLSFDASVSSAPAGFVSTVNAVAQFFQTNFSDNVTINVNVGFGEIAGQAITALGQSLTPLGSFSYTAIKNALAGDAKTSDDSIATATLPATSPLAGASYWVARAEAKALGLLGASSTSDGSIGFSSSTGIFDYDRSDGIAAGKYDFFAVVAHELSEVMGRQLMVGETFAGRANSLEPMDLFHYSAAGLRDFVGTQAGYFSLDGGSTNLDSFNTNPGGDFGDWAASAGNDAFNAFGNPGVIASITDADLRVMDVIGWDRVVAPAPQTPTIQTGPQVHWTATVDIGPHPASWLPNATGDFNHDGTSDLVWYNATTNNLDLWKIVNGKWAGSVDMGTHPAGYTPSATGDFNGDGTPDVLWFNPTSGDVDIWKISNGQWAGSVDAGLHPLGWQVAGSGDFNADGTADVLWFNPTTGDVDIWKISNGQWAGSVDVGTHPAGYTPVGTGDFDHDGTTDVLWYNPTTRDVDLWRMSNGHWAGSVDIGTHPAGWVPAGIGDFNHDGFADVAWREVATNRVEIWLLTYS